MREGREGEDEGKGRAKEREREERKKRGAMGVVEMNKGGSNRW